MVHERSPMLRYTSIVRLVCISVLPPYPPIAPLTSFLLMYHTNNIPWAHAPLTAIAQWLRCCATNRKVAGSIPDGVIGIVH